MSKQEATIQLDIVSDVMCPWCLIGKRRLEKALEQLDDLKIDLRWRPYQLDPTLPPEGRDRTTYLETKFGGPEKAREIYSRIEEAGQREGIDFNFDAIEVSPNTLDAHRVIRWSANEEQGVQDRLVERLFTDFFIDGRNIGDHAVLAAAAKDAGMDSDIVLTLLASDKDRAEVEEEIAVAQRIGVTGVPCFIIDNKFAVMGAQEPDQIVAAIRQAASAA